MFPDRFGKRIASATSNLFGEGIRGAFRYFENGLILIALENTTTSGKLGSVDISSQVVEKIKVNLESCFFPQSNKASFPCPG